MEENKKDVLPLEGEPLTAPQISEPVVNALAAALSKIETYVPTQYINDGPPDIDADHLNHAEQAIMRVTNLANGAADAIAALQSQLAQLNSRINKTLSTGILDYALTLPQGMHTVLLDGGNYSGNDLPNDRYKYSSALILVRSNGKSISVILYGFDDYPIAINHHTSSDGWLGWNTYVTTSDFGYIDVDVNTVANTSIVIDNAPSGSKFIPVVVARKSNNDAKETIGYDSNRWIIMSDVSQTVTVRFFKYPA